MENPPPIEPVADGAAPSPSRLPPPGTVLVAGGLIAWSSYLLFAYLPDTLWQIEGPDPLFTMPKALAAYTCWWITIAGMAFSGLGLLLRLRLAPALAAGFTGAHLLQLVALRVLFGPSMEFGDHLTALVAILLGLVAVRLSWWWWTRRPRPARWTRAAILAAEAVVAVVLIHTGVEKGLLETHRILDLLETSYARSQGIAARIPLPRLDGEIRPVREDGNRATVVYFWRVGCDRCLPDLPRLDALQAEYADRGVEVVLVHTGDETEERIRRTLIEHGAGTLTCLLDRDGHSRRIWGRNSIPWTYILDGEGRTGYSYGVEEIEADLGRILRRVGPD